MQWSFSINGQSIEFLFHWRLISPHMQSALTLFSGQAVGFGNDMIVGCSISLTRAELQDLCLSQNHTFLSQKQTASGYIYIPRWLVNDVDYIGIYGNADPSQEDTAIILMSLVLCSCCHLQSESSVSASLSVTV